MKVIYVVDSISDLTKKINILSNRFGSDIFYVVKANLVEIFKTYGLSANAIYFNNLTEVIHSLLIRSDVEDTIICYSSLKFDNKLINKFTNSIGDKSKVVNLMPNYNIFEQICNSVYNVYVKSLFKINDSLASSKLQFLPKLFVEELLDSHLGNRLFEIDPDFAKNIYSDDAEINKSMKTKSHSVKYDIISIIIALVVTIGLLASIAYLKANFIAIMTCVLFYLLDITLTIIFHCKAKFDQRFLK